MSRGLQSRARYCFNGLGRPTPSIAASFYARSSRQARPLPGMKFHCEQSPSSPGPRQGPSGATPLLPSPHNPPALPTDGDMAMPKGRGDRGMAAPQPRASSPPASASSSLLPPCASNKGASVPVPLACTAAAAETLPQNRNTHTHTPRKRAEGPGVTGRSPGTRILALQQSPDCSKEQRLQEK